MRNLGDAALGAWPLTWNLDHVARHRRVDWYLALQRKLQLSPDQRQPASTVRHAFALYQLPSTEEGFADVKIVPADTDWRVPRRFVWNLTARIHRSGARWGLWATRQSELSTNPPGGAFC